MSSGPRFRLTRPYRPTDRCSFRRVGTLRVHRRHSRSGHSPHAACRIPLARSRKPQSFGPGLQARARRTMRRKKRVASVIDLGSPPPRSRRCLLRPGSKAVAGGQAQRTKLRALTDLREATRNNQGRFAPEFLGSPRSRAPPAASRAQSQPCPPYRGTILEDVPVKQHSDRREKDHRRHRAEPERIRRSDGSRATAATIIPARNARARRR